MQSPRVGDGERGSTHAYNQVVGLSLSQDLLVDYDTVRCRTCCFLVLLRRHQVHTFGPRNRSFDYRRRCNESQTIIQGSRCRADKGRHITTDLVCSPDPEKELLATHAIHHDITRRSGHVPETRLSALRHPLHLPGIHLHSPHIRLFARLVLGHRLDIQFLLHLPAIQLLFCRSRIDESTTFHRRFDRLSVRGIAE